MISLVYNDPIDGKEEFSFKTRQECVDHFVIWPIDSTLRKLVLDERICKFSITTDEPIVINFEVL